jgi:hypothetical protein
VGNAADRIAQALTLIVVDARVHVVSVALFAVAVWVTTVAVAGVRGRRPNLGRGAGAELAELVQFLHDWLAADGARRDGASSM